MRREDVDAGQGTPGVRAEHEGAAVDALAPASDSRPRAPVRRDEPGRFRPGGAPPPRRKGGGQPGNLSGAKHPYRSFYKRLALPKRYRYLLPLIEHRVAALADDKGGAEQLTAAEAALLDTYRRAHGASLLLLAEAHERGYIREDSKTGAWDLHPGARELSRFAALEVKILQTLGLERRARNAPLAEWLARREAQGAAKGSSSSAPPIDVQAAPAEPPGPAPGAPSERAHAQKPAPPAEPDPEPAEPRELLSDVEDRAAAAALAERLRAGFEAWRDGDPDAAEPVLLGGERLAVCVAALAELIAGAAGAAVRIGDLRGFLAELAHGLRAITGNVSVSAEGRVLLADETGADDPGRAAVLFAVGALGVPRPVAGLALDELERRAAVEAGDVARARRLRVELLSGMAGLPASDGGDEG